MNVAQFYAEDERRQRSPEVAFGTEWRTDADPAALYALRWIRDTQEIYVLREPQPPRHGWFDPEYGMTFFAPVTNAELPVELLGWARDEDAINDALAGWATRMRQPNSLEWLRAQLAKAAAKSDWTYGEPVRTTW